MVNLMVPVAEKRYGALPPNLPPIGLSREAAAAYIGVGATKFDEMVRDGRMPKPKIVDSRKVWSRAALDAAFAALPDEDGPSKGWYES